MKKLTYKLYTTPDKVPYLSDRYKAVLMLNGGMCKALPHESTQSIEEFREYCKQEAKMFNGTLQEI